MGTKRPCPSRGMYRHNQCVAISGAVELFKALNTDLGNEAAGLLERGDFAGILQLSIDPLIYDCAESFRDDYFVVEHLSKFPNFDVGIDRVAVAMEKFRKSEMDCLQANQRLKSSYGTASTTVSVASLIYTAQRKIARLLGPLNWDEAEQHFGFGPGSTTSLKRTHGDAYYKFGAFKPHVTKECLALAYTAVRRIPRWFASLAGYTGEISDDVMEELYGSIKPEDLFTIVPGNQVITVPKSAKTDRVIAKEPDMNMFVQKGLGAVIRRRLKRVGVDLDDQSLNQRLALEGSITGNLATVDLSAASDSVALELCRVLLPPDWYAAIETCRCAQGTLPSGEVISYQKVSSMGNGFTFELEALIFWALIESVKSFSSTIERRVAVYGDDLIFSVDLYDSVVELLGFCGFTCNAKKSFATGKFRESCGKHYFAGRDVTPFYVRKDIGNPERLLWYANSIRRWARNPTWGLDVRLEACHKDVVAKLPKFWQQPRIPDGLGDIALIGDFDEVRPRKARNGLAGWACTGVSERITRFVPDDLPILLKALYQQSRFSTIKVDGLDSAEREVNPLPSGISWIHGVLRQEGVRDRDLLPVSKKARVTRYRVVRPVTEQWESFGPWL